ALGPFLQRGDPYVPGDDLALYSEPIWRDTTLRGREGAFEARFWPDGTARLSAYELQGLLQSPCTQGGELTCTSCHDMHGGDPAGQLREEARGDGACLGCHAGMDASGDHDRHPSAIECVQCHMPRIVYGLVAVHPSHRIESPDPAEAARVGRPDACTLCHVDRDQGWASEALRALWGPSGAGPRAAPEAGSREALPYVRRALFGGDPIERAVAIEALGVDALADSALGPIRLGDLLEVMRSDPYPALRRMAWREAQRVRPDARIPWEAYRATDRPAERRHALAEILRALGPGSIEAPERALVSRLRAAAREVQIVIGE
ncbi:MAG: hypothetical protein OEY14_16660, partial [Myxococcales bacterium]|nr:hypothetical protein [Myxococcales bacterium]